MSEYILALESSCDETAAAVVKDGRHVLSNVIASQIDIHKRFGGVVPEIASRKHTEVIAGVVREALSQADMDFGRLDYIAVTCGPGLVGALLVAVNYGKALAYALGKPLLAVNHIDGHISANYIDSDFEPPYLCLVVSGGHTELVYVKDYGDYETLSSTRDDAAGEAFDKASRLLGLGYPGGPAIQKAAEDGDPFSVVLPRPLKTSKEFSFSGMKTAIARIISSENRPKTADIAASFQYAAVDILKTKTDMAVKEYGVKKIALAGGVCANRCLRETFADYAAEEGLAFHMPALIYCTDNAAMIGAAAHYLHDKSGALMTLNAYPSLKLQSSEVWKI